MSSSVGSAASAADAAALRRAMFAETGMPVPLFDGKRTPTHDSMNWDAKIGVLVHQVIGQVAPTIGSLSPDDGRALVAEAVDRTVRAKSLGRLGKARTRATGMVLAYVSRYLPPIEAEFLGTELVVGAGRVDLAWRLPGVGVWFDEVKTWRHQGVGLDRDTWEQIHRYTAAGQDAFGHEFVGLRVLTLGQVTGSVAVDPWGFDEPLDGSVLAPSRLVGRRAA